MIFFFKRKKLVVDCFINDEYIFDIFKIQPARKFYPDWWKNLEPICHHPMEKGKPFSGGATMRSCAGLIDYYRTGMIMPMWSDLGFEVGKTGSNYLRIVLSSTVGTAEQHPVEQRGVFLPQQHYSHVKIISPWLVKSTRPVQFILMKPFWNFDRPEELLVPNGGVNFYYQHSTNINLFVKHEKEPKTIKIEAGDPILHFVPQTEDKVEIKNHLISDDEYGKMSAPMMRSFFINGYSRYKKFKEAADKAKD